MEDTDTASSAVDGMEMMNVGEPGAQEPQRSSEVGGDHEERGETPKRMALVTHELEKLRMSVYAEKFERHGFDHWPCVLLSGSNTPCRDPQLQMCPTLECPDVFWPVSFSVTPDISPCMRACAGRSCGCRASD